MSLRSALAMLLCALATTLSPRPVTAQGTEAPRVRVELVSEVAGIAPGQTFWVALQQRIAPGWHTYWMNPGDSGEAPRIEWSLPPGFTVGEFAWPLPDRIRVGSAMTYGYSESVVLPISVTPPADLVPGTRVTLKGQAGWLVCEEICIPEEAPLALTLPVVRGAPAVDARGAALIEAARRSIPTQSPWRASFAATPQDVTLMVDAPGLAADRISEVWFYPARWGAIDLTAPQRVRVDAAGITIDVARGRLTEASAAPIEGVLAVAERLDGGTVRHGFSMTASPTGLGVTKPTSLASLLSALGLALAGGLVLNLMPCVLPVLSIKALGLVQLAGARAATLARHGLAYTAGVLVSFAIVAGALIALRATGERLGWGFQLQSPAFVTLLAWLFFTMALSLSGAIVVSTRFTGAGQALAARPGHVGSFATGALATVAATPCTAPFMGAAVGFALAQPWPTALLVFEALGLGLALPFLILTLLPAWRRALPAPGAWTVRLQQLLAFPLYATVAWLVWVVSQQAGPQGVAAALAGLLVIGFAGWLYQTSRGAQARWRRAATLAAIALAAVSVALGTLAGAASAGRVATTSAGWEPFSAARLAELRAAGKPVFVNVTAAWCITCLVNERVALGSRAVSDAFARNGITALKADWTRRDPSITQVLGAFGRNGVPLYLVYPAGAGRPPAVLPQILSETIVLNALDKETP